MWLRLSVAHDGAGAWASLSDWQQVETSLLHVTAVPITWQQPGFKSLTLWGHSKAPKGASYAPLVHNISTALQPRAHWNTTTLWQTPRGDFAFEFSMKLCSLCFLLFIHPHPPWTTEMAQPLSTSTDYKVRQGSCFSCWGTAFLQQSYLGWPRKYVVYLLDN